jgi:hypothetical protein
LPHLMKTPTDKVIPYMIVSAIVIFVMYLIVGAVTAATAGIGMATHF